MKTLTIASLLRPLTVLEVAEENLLSTGAKLSSALVPYDNERREIERQIHELHVEIDELRTEMDAITGVANEDPTIAALTDEHEEWQGLYSQALDDVKGAATTAWFMGKTEGIKQWRQDEWEVKLRTTYTPTVTKPYNFLSHLREIGAESIVKSVKVTLDKKATVELNGIVMGLRGLEVEEKTSVSVTRAGVTEEN